jgi:hypothetical protein
MWPAVTVTSPACELAKYKRIVGGLGAGNGAVRASGITAPKVQHAIRFVGLPRQLESGRSERCRATTLSGERGVSNLAGEANEQTSLHARVGARDRPRRPLAILGASSAMLIARQGAPVASSRRAGSEGERSSMHETARWPTNLNTLGWLRVENGREWAVAKPGVTFSQSKSTSYAMRRVL